MSIIDSLRYFLRGEIRGRYQTIADLDALMDLQIAGAKSATGLSISPETALRSVAVYACVAVLADTISTLPFPVYRRLAGGGKTRATDSYLYNLLHDEPNPEMTPASYWDCVVGHVALWGNHYSEIERRQYDGRVLALWPLRPDRMEIRRETAGGPLIYEYRLPDGQKKPFAPEQIFHLPGRSGNGIVGYSVIHEAREAIALSISLEEYGARFFGNDSRPGGVLEYPGKLTPDNLENLKRSWEAGHKGLSQAHRVAILEQGTTWKSVGIPPEDAQFLESRKLQTNEIARLFKIPPHKIGDLERATFSNIEHQAIEFVVDTIRPWLVRIEQRVKRSLFSPQERATLFPEFLVDGLLRGDIKSRYEAYAVGRQNGWLCPDEIREFENMNPLPDGTGKVYLVPLNMIPADMVGQMNDPPEEPPSQDEGRSLSLVEQRGAGARKRIRASYRRLFRESLGRCIKREVSAVGQEIDRQLTRRDLGSLLLWLEDYYQRKYPLLVRQNIEPLLGSLAELIDEAAAGEAGIAPEVGPGLEQLAGKLADDYARELAGRNLGQLTSIIRDHETDQEGMGDALRTRLDEWSEKRADKMAGLWAVGAASAVAISTWRRGGISRKRSVAHGQNCPFCNGLNGKVIGIDEHFLSAGQEYQPEGAESALRPKRNLGHPPYHNGCNCDVMLERG